MHRVLARVHAEGDEAAAEDAAHERQPASDEPRAQAWGRRGGNMGNLVLRYRITVHCRMSCDEPRAEARGVAGKGPAKRRLAKGGNLALLLLLLLCVGSAQACDGGQWQAFV